MIDLNKEVAKIDCPDCKRACNVTLKQIADGMTIRCACGQAIKLIDSKGHVKKAIRDVNKGFRDLEKTFARFGR